MELCTFRYPVWHREKCYDDRTRQRPPFLPTFLKRVNKFLLIYLSTKSPPSALSIRRVLLQLDIDSKLKMLSFRKFYGIYGSIFVAVRGLSCFQTCFEDCTLPECNNRCGGEIEDFSTDEGLLTFQLPGYINVTCGNPKDLCLVREIELLNEEGVAVQLSLLQYTT